MSESFLCGRKPNNDYCEGSGRRPIFKVGENVRISVRYPLGHYRVPRYIPAQFRNRRRDEL